MNAVPPAAILAFDFDGTLVEQPSDPYEIARLEKTLTDRQRHGAVWGVNTGRTLPHVLDGLRDHGFQTTPDFIIARECEIYRPDRGRWVDFHGWNRACHADHAAYYHSHAPFFRELQHYLRKTKTTVQFISDPSEPAGLVSHDEAGMSAVCAWLTAQQSEWPQLTWQRNSIWLRFTSPGYDKGTTLLAIRKELGISAAQTFAAGDNYNDLPMLRPEIAEALACPANSIPEVIQQVTQHGGFHAQEDSTTGILSALHRHHQPAGIAHHHHL